MSGRKKSLSESLANDAEDIGSASEQNFSDVSLSEDSALIRLKQTGLPVETLTEIAKNRKLLESRKVKIALVQHPHTPRHVLLPLLRHLFTFDLMKVALTPAIASDVKMAAEENLIHRLEKLSLGEKVTLARRASGRVAAALLKDSQLRVIVTALENSHLTEALLLRELTNKNARADLVSAVCNHSKWALRSEIKLALLRNRKTPFEDLVSLAKSLPRSTASEAIEDSELSGSTKARLLVALAQ